LISVTDQEQQRVAVGPGNSHFITIHQDGATRAGTVVCPPPLLPLPPPLLLAHAVHMQADDFY